MGRVTYLNTDAIKDGSISESKVNLTSYVHTTSLNETLASYVQTTKLNETLISYVQTSDMPKIYKLGGSGLDLTVGDWSISSDDADILTELYNNINNTPIVILYSITSDNSSTIIQYPTIVQSENTLIFYNVYTTDGSAKEFTVTREDENSNWGVSVSDINK